MTTQILTQSRLKEILHYDPDTGIFTRKVSHSNRVRVGDQVGVRMAAGYLSTSINQKNYYMHRLAFLYVTGKIPEEIDHIDHNPKNNKWGNLRSVTHKENGRNMRISKRNKSGITGVLWDKSRGKWRAEIVVDGASIYGGRFANVQDAVNRRKELEKSHLFHKNHGAAQ